MRKNVPFLIFLATVLILMLVIYGGLALFTKLDRLNADRMLSLLAKGKVEEANHALTAITFYGMIDYYDSPFKHSFLKSLASSLGETEIAIKDTVDLRKYRERIGTWPQPLRAVAKMDLWQDYWRMNPQRLPPKELYKVVNRFREIMRWEQDDKKVLRAFYGQSHLQSNRIEQTLVISPPILSIVQFFLIGPILLLILLWEWRLERKHPLTETPFSTFALSSLQRTLVLGIYLLALILTSLTLLPVLRSEPFTSALSIVLYLFSLAASILIILPLALLLILRLDIRRMGKGNGITEPPQRGTVLLSWVKQYKLFLWRLWPAWLVCGVAAWFLNLWFWHYQMDLYALYLTVRPW